MKINSRKFLVFCYALSGRPVLYSHLTYLWPEISAGGRRGLISHLQKQRLISVQYVGKQAQISLSAIGRAWVEEEYFSAKKTDSLGTLVLLYPGTSFSDIKIKQLKARLRLELVELGPRTFFSQADLSEELITSLRKRYYSVAAVLTVGNWVIGDPNVFSNYYLHKKSQSDLTSGISSQLQELIEKKIVFSSASDQAKLQIFSLLDRLFEIIEINDEITSDENSSDSPGMKLLSLFSSLFPSV